MSINTIAIHGRLVAAPELRYTAKGTAVANGSIAVHDGHGDYEKTYYFDYTAWRQTAEYMAKYAEKGMAVTLQGKLTQETWQNQNGENRHKTIIVAQDVVLPPRPTNDNLYGEEITFDDADLPF